MPINAMYNLMQRAACLLCLTLAAASPLANASDTDIQLVVSRVQESNFTGYQHAIEGMGLGVYGGPLYNQATRGRLFTGLQGDKGNQEARAYLLNQLTGFGLPAAVQGKFYNVVAEQTGATNPQNVFIIAAHYDTVKSNVPGGDGDASGTAAVLEAARVLSQFKFDNTIRYVVFNATPKMQAGSNDYVKNIVGIGTEKLIGIVYLDSILHPYHDANPALLQALNVGVVAKTGPAAAWAALFATAAQQFVPALALDSGGPAIDLANDQFSFITYGYLSSLRLSENSSKNIANAALNKPDDASNAAAGAHYDYTFATNVTRATVALMAQQAGYLGVSDSSGVALADSDGDGYADEIETELGSDPASALSTPKNLPPATQAGALETISALVSLDFSSSSADIVTVIGTLPIHAGFVAKDAVVIIDVAGIVKTVTLKSTGSGKTGTNGFGLKIKSANGAVPEQIAQFSFTLGQGNFKRQLAPLGLTNVGFLGRPVTIPITLIFAGKVRSTRRILQYTSKMGVSGFAH